jgi:hypothetical protein
MAITMAEVTFIFSAAAMTGDAMYGLIASADPQVAERRTSVEAEAAAAMVGMEEGGKPRESLDKTDLINL